MFSIAVTVSRSGVTTSVETELTIIQSTAQHHFTLVYSEGHYFQSLSKYPAFCWPCIINHFFYWKLGKLISTIMLYSMTSLTLLSSSKIDQMMTTKGFFSFRNDNICETTLDDGIVLRIERIGPAIARVYFVDDSFSEISIPNGLVIRDITNNVPVAPPTADVQFFVLAWSDTYSIIFNGELITELATQRQWSLRGPLNRAIRTIDD